MTYDLFTTRQTYGYHCASCGELWDAYQVPCLMEVALRNMKANGTCIRCGSEKIMIVMPHRYQELQRERASSPDLPDFPAQPSTNQGERE